MSILSLLIPIAVVGFIVWLILQIAMPPVFRKIIIAVVTVVLILWVLQQLGIHTGLPRLRWQ